MTVVAAPAALHAITTVDVEEFRQGGVLVDRRVTVTLECGHTHQEAIPLTADLPRVGEGSSYGCCAGREAR